MAQILRMQHIEHGYHVAYDSAEVERLKEAGWTPISEADFRAKVAGKNGEVEDSAEDAPPPVKPKAKTGPKPKA